jgi:hypothetical protein
MTPADLIRTLPQIQQALSVFLDPREVAEKTGAMRRLVKTSWPAMPAVRPPSQDEDKRIYQEDPEAKSTS